MVFRKPTNDELRLLKELARIGKVKNADEWLSTLTVEEMDDGGMGSLRLVAEKPTEQESNVVFCKAAVQFFDEDGVVVIASLNAGGDGSPFELDMWKTDFSPLIRIGNDFRKVKE